MRRILAAALILLSSNATAAADQTSGLSFLGRGRIINNDVLFDLKDRWRTGSVAASYVWGPDWNGALPTSIGRLIELRFQGEIIAPDNLKSAAPGDRPYANALSLGLHSHFDWRGLQVAAGADLVMTGDQTGLYQLQRVIHKAIGVDGPSTATRAAGIGNGFHPGAVLELGRDFALGGARLRPFVEGRYGVETLARAGIDLTIGRISTGALMVRDPVSGNRYRVLAGEHALGPSLVIGADYALVRDSLYLPQPAFDPLNRARLRAGLHWQGKRGRAFYGITWLSKEFAGQPEGQFIGSLRLDYEF